MGKGIPVIVQGKLFGTKREAARYIKQLLGSKDTSINAYGIEKEL